jgi:aquaporin Z
LAPLAPREATPVVPTRIEAHRMRTVLRPLVAEAVGTFFLVFVGVAAIVSNAYREGSVGLLGIAAAHGLALAVGVSATMHVSGGHLNPAVTLGLFSVGRIGPRDAGLYVVAQLLGAILAAYAAKELLPEMAGVVTQLGTPKLAPDVTTNQGMVIEAVLTFLLVFAVFGTAVDPAAPKIGGFGIGTVVLFDILAGGNLTGAAMNPARAFGPALISGTWIGQFIYWVGPILGGIAAAQLYERVLLKKA